MKTYAEISEGSPLSEDKLKILTEMVAGLGNYTPEYARISVEWFCNVLGMGEYYFNSTPLNRMASHLASIMAAEILGRIRGGESTDLNLISETDDEAMYVILDSHKTAVDLERRIETRYPGARLQSYRTRGKSGKFHLRIYFASAPTYDTPPGKSALVSELGCRQFQRWSTDPMRELIQKFYDDSLCSHGPFIRISPKEDTKEIRVMVVLHGAKNLGFFSAVSDVIDSYGLYSNRKFVEPLSNGSRIYLFYIDSALLNEQRFEQLQDDISRAYVLPRTEVSPLFEQGRLSAQEACYGFAGTIFANQFLTGYNVEYARLAKVLKDDPQLLGVLTNLKTRLVKDTFTQGRIQQALFRHPHLVKQLYTDFARRHFKNGFNGLSPLELSDPPDEALNKQIKREVEEEVDQTILRFFLKFNRHVLKTNFYKADKTSLAFRLDPAFLEEMEYGERPYGIFFVLGGEFRAYHIRFRDVARGGIRIVRSSNLPEYIYNRNFIFEENYNLARTQQYKNKDIPEGGAKGTILLSNRHQDKAELCFEKYIDGLLDLLMPDEKIRDHYGREELLFLGPDEGTAELMEWAAERAKLRGYSFWKSFTTGKPPRMGGIPHDTHGMTTHSVHTHVLAILEREGVDETKVTKIQTGGPDGDLGSNEILVSRDRTIAIVDGSGVLYDPEGLNRTELTRLAGQKKMIEHFHSSYLSAEGFRVTVRENDIRLPNGELVESGLDFRNTFHVHPLATADLFVPCGGRPRAIHINNVDLLFDEEGWPKFKYIVEGANLFITQEARLALEKAGVILIKDATANKGGVTSSSLEVLAGLALTDEEYERNMTVTDGEIPPFRKHYIDEVLVRIGKNARSEFECIWSEGLRTGRPRSELSDTISLKINRVFDAVAASDLWSAPDLQRSVLAEALPETLLAEVGLETLLKRIPANYLIAIFAAHIGSHYVYQHGLDTTEVDFINFLEKYRQRAAHP